MAGCGPSTNREELKQEKKARLEERDFGGTQGLHFRDPSVLLLLSPHGRVQCSAVHCREVLLKKKHIICRLQVGYESLKTR